VGASDGGGVGRSVKIGEYLVFAAFAFHAVNGIRLVIVELGWGVGKPIEPVYPYRTSVDAQRFLAVARSWWRGSSPRSAPPISSCWTRRRP